ncbi:hypothetical protein FOL47_010325 [Perkinsus chesapeaki]|uniref:Tyr recombinase domain-containing protein n=1 Tax=Perkinsus chesapeaki TaxID=330153 RepID=A0A7J6L2N6_PERCH|nr:hypothetical protein FOL47_010325 [Perkinsus chesapeaki]
MAERHKRATDFLAKARADGKDLSEEVADLVRSALAPTTRKTYTSGERLFRAVVLGPKTRIDKMYPVSANSVLTFIYILNKVGYAFSTIKTYTAAIKTRNIENGHTFSYLEIEHARRALIAVRRRSPVGKYPPGAKAQVTIGQVRQALEQCNGRKRESGVALLLCIFGLLRCRECISPTCSDVIFNTIENMDVVDIVIRRSKCDRFGEGAAIRIGCSYGSSKRPCTELFCAVHKLYSYMCEGSTAKTLHREGPLFGQLNHQTFRRHIEAAFELCVSNSHNTIATHSLRRSGAQWMWVAGISTFSISQFGRWAIQNVLEKTYLTGVTKVFEHR